jgi:hypothetical protein
LNILDIRKPSLDQKNLEPQFPDYSIFFKFTIFAIFISFSTISQFQLNNIPMDAAMKTKWTVLKEKQHFLKSWKYFGARDHHLHIYLKQTRSAIEKLIFAEDTIENLATLKNINDQISKYQVRKRSNTFKNVIDEKFKTITNELFKTILTRLIKALDNPLRKLNIWTTANTISFQQRDLVVSSIYTLKFEIIKYFQYMNPNIIFYWFFNHQSRVPHDWESRLMDFNDRFFVTAIKAKRHKITDFSEFIDVLDYTVRTSFEMAKNPSDFQNFVQYYKKVENLYIARKDSMGNLSQFFIDWREIIPEYSLVPIKSVTHLENEYEMKFKNVVNEHDLPNLWNCVKRALFYMQDVYNFNVHRNQSETDTVDPNNLLTIQSITDQLQYQVKPTYMDFQKQILDRFAQKLIIQKYSKIESVLEHIHEILIQHFKFLFDDDWLSSQPYKKLFDLKYSNEYYEDFYTGIDRIFATTNLSYPEEDFKVLKDMNMYSRELQKLANMLLATERINTKFDWGRGLRKSQDYHRNVAVSLSSPINVGFKTLMSGVEITYACTVNIHSVLLLGSVLLMKMRKWIKRF